MSARGRKSKKRTVFAAGCFNRVHQAHVTLLKTARAFGDELIVVISHDAHTRKQNAVPAVRRRLWIEGLGIADRVIVGRAESFAQSLRQARPDVLVLGYDQRFPDAETASAVRELGIRVVQLPWYPGKERPWPGQGS